MGDPNASIPTPQPVHYRPMFGAFAKARSASCMTFVSKNAFDNGVAEALQLSNMIHPVSNTRKITKADLIHNHYQPTMEVDPQTYEVRADGELLICEPMSELPLAQRYFLF